MEQKKFIEEINGQNVFFKFHENVSVQIQKAQ